ncbi:MAG: VIT domain-containing protein [Pyrinomonadaceae bacterium]
MRRVVFLLLVLVCSVAAFGQQTTEGSLYAVGKTGTELGACPLKNTAVKAQISGFISRVSVRQEFVNSYSEAIEAVYVFPLSQNGAVDQMTMTVGERVVRGKIMRREEARRAYDAAKSQGKTASLLDQERPNIFTQSVANIMPGEKVVIDISYVETLKYEDGGYEFVFPMTVGPRYIPGGVPDAAKIKPPYAETRNGSDISIEVNLNAGVPVEEVRSSTHELTEIKMTPTASKLTLRNEKTIPNKDFILRYDVTGKRIEDAVLTHRDPRGGFFTMILQPPDKIANEDRTPKEIVFVLDTSGSMGGFPIEKANEAMKLSLDGLYPDDTFNLITFSGDTHVLFEKPVPATRANLDAAQAFLQSRSGGGGTEMMKAIKAALDPSDAADHLRIVCFMTDGYVGNENEIVAEIQRHPNARVFSFGIGSSVNRFLLDKMAAEGKGEVEYVALNDDGSKAAKRFYERVRTPLLTDISVDWNGLPIADVYPGKLTDLFSSKPVILHGRYTKGASGTIRLKGKVAGQDYVREIAVNLPETEAANDVLSTLWARTRIDELSSSRLKAATPALGTEIDSQITNIGLEFGLMTSFTSFVAVEERVVNTNGIPTTVKVPVVVPEGVNPVTSGAVSEVVTVAGVQSLPINARSSAQLLGLSSSPQFVKNEAVSGKSKGKGSGSGQGSGSGSGGGLGSGIGNGAAATVDVSGGDQVSAISETPVTTNITASKIELLPKGAEFTSALRMSAGTFAVDGVSGSENTFVVDGTEVTNFRTGASNPNDRRTLGGRTLMIVEPTYSKELREAKVTGEVEVEVKIDKQGNVASATALSGDKRLRDSAEQAAKLSKFAPTLAGSRAVNVSGILAYKYSTAEKVAVFVRKMKAKKPTEAERRADAVAGKLHIWLFAVVDRLAVGDTKPTANEPNFVRDGKANVLVTLTAYDPTVLEKLRKAGFEAAGTNAKGVSGSVPIDKIADLAAIGEVTLVTPRF